MAHPLTPPIPGFHHVTRRDEFLALPLIDDQDFDAAWDRIILVKSKSLN